MVTPEFLVNFCTPCVYLVPTQQIIQTGIELSHQSLVIIPTYNEIENIEAIVRTVASLERKFDILIIDDGSPDGTNLKVRELQSVMPGLHLLERKGKLGLGTAYITGFKWGLERNYDFLFEMDADFSHNPYDLVRLQTVLDSGVYDVAVGSRYIPGGKVVNWPKDRLFLSRGASYYVKLVTWMPVNDPTAGFVGYTRQTLTTLDLDKIKFIGYAFQIEMKFACWSMGFRIKEIPITFKDREQGSSKMSGSIVSEAIKGVLLMKWRSLKMSYKKSSK